MELKERKVYKSTVVLGDEENPWRGKNEEMREREGV
jgi:hypothetical protein